MAEYAEGRVKVSVNCKLTKLNLMDYHRLTTGEHSQRSWIYTDQSRTV